MITKQAARVKDKVDVTFVLPREEPVQNVCICGDWDAWQPNHIMQQINGDWKYTLELERGREYQFRYLVNGEQWQNDPNADNYVPNPFGSENFVVVT